MNATMPSAAIEVQMEVMRTLVVYEDLSTRERATAVCDDLVKQFWPEIHFKFDWWRVSFLEDKGFADLAARCAVDSDFVIFSGSGHRELSVAAKRWFESWSKRRERREGALVDLTETADSVNGAAELKKIYLRDIAARAFMDYVTKLPAAIRTNLRVRKQSLPTHKAESSLGSKTVSNRIPERWLVPAKD